MNVKELGIYTALRNTPEEYRITDGGTRFYTLVYNTLVCFEGERLDELSQQELFDFFQRERLKLLESWA